MKICPKCKKETSIKDYSKSKNRKGGLGVWCKDCVNQSSRRYFKREYKKDPKKYAEKQKQWNLKNPKRKSEIQSKHKQKVRMEVLRAYSNGKIKCICCGEDEIKFLSLDHIKGKGKVDREKNGYGNAFYASMKRQGYPKGLQVLCHNCNLAKSLYGKCPHKNNLYGN